MFAFAGIKTGWDKRKEQRCLLVLCLLCWKTGWDKRKKQKMPVCLCLCTFIEIRRGTKNLDLVLCTVVYIGLGKTSVTIWTISSVENWGNHWGKWTILRSFQDHMGDPAWWHWGCNLTAYTRQWSDLGLIIFFIIAYMFSNNYIWRYYSRYVIRM